MKKIFYFGLFGFLLSSCGGTTSEETEDNTTETDSMTMDTIAASMVLPDMEEMLQSISNRSGEYTGLPFSIDSAYFEPFENEEVELTRLTGDEVKYLSTTLVDNPAIRNPDHPINIFLDIDTLINKGEYDNYVDNLDIGMTQISEAFMGEKITISDSTFIQLWAITYSSYPACPFFILQQSS